MVYHNGNDISALLSVVGASISAGSPPAGITITRRDVFEYEVVFGFGISVTIVINSGGVINVLLTIPASLLSQTRGLLGNSDGDPSNDFRPRTGGVLPDDISDRDLHNMFGLSCKFIPIFIIMMM